MGRIRRLGTNAQISFFTAVLGEPPAMRRTEESSTTSYDDEGSAYQVPATWIECVWIDRDFYVHGVADEDETIHAFSVTTRSKHFRPKFRQSGGFWIERGRIKRLLRFPEIKLYPQIKLGKTTFHALGRPEQAASWVGAHNAHYFEAYWGANPGLYQWFVYSINDAGYGAWRTPWTEHMHAFAWGFGAGAIDPQLLLAETAAQLDSADMSGAEAPEGIDYDPTSNEPGVNEEVQADEQFGFDLQEYVEEPLPTFYEDFRRHARINTYTVIGPELALDDYPFFTPPPEGYPTFFGVRSVRTRTLAGEQS